MIRSQTFISASSLTTVGELNIRSHFTTPVSSLPTTVDKLNKIRSQIFITASSLTTMDKLNMIKSLHDQMQLWIN